MKEEQNKFMVVYINLANGKIAPNGVWASKKVGTVDAVAEDGKDIETAKKRKVQHSTSVPTFYAGASPGCRYIQTAGGWKKVCN